MTNHPTRTLLLTTALLAAGSWAAPGIPEDLQATRENHDVTLTWRGADDAYAYQVRRSVLAGQASGDDANFVTLAVVPRGSRAEQRYVDHVVGHAGGSYSYAVAAIDENGTTSPLSSIVGMTGPDDTAPAAPMISELKILDGAIILRWTAPPDADIVGYHVLRRSGDEAFAELTASLISDRQFRDANVADGTSYEYAVVAEDQRGNRSRISTPRSRRALVRAGLAAVTAVAAATRDGRPEISWAVYPNARGYIVARSEREATGFVPVSGLLTGPGYRDGSAVAASYYYVIIAVLESNRRTPPSTPTRWRREP